MSPTGPGSYKGAPRPSKKKSAPKRKMKTFVKTNKRMGGKK